MYYAGQYLAFWLMLLSGLWFFEEYNPLDEDGIILFRRGMKILISGLAE